MKAIRHYLFARDEYVYRFSDDSVCVLISDDAQEQLELIQQKNIVSIQNGRQFMGVKDFVQYMDQFELWHGSRKVVAFPFVD